MSIQQINYFIFIQKFIVTIERFLKVQSILDNMITSRKNIFDPKSALYNLSKLLFPGKNLELQYNSVQKYGIACYLTKQWSAYAEPTVLNCIANKIN